MFIPAAAAHIKIFSKGDMGGSEPPIFDALKALYIKAGNKCPNSIIGNMSERYYATVEDFRLPLIDFNRLSMSSIEQESCKQEIVNAAASHGFFQVINHGIPKRALKRWHHQQMKLFQLPFLVKSGENFMNLPSNSYRWGNAAAQSVGQFMWSEAFHVGVANASNLDVCNRLSLETFASGAASLSKSIANILAQNLGVRNTNFFEENFSSDSCYLRLNRYPPCHLSSEVFGFIPHTDSDFITILSQDEVGGLQLEEEGQWYNVQPIPDALVVNIGDLFEAWSNGVYKSVRHRVVADAETERLSVAYFFCPSYETVIESCMGSEQQLPIYRKFSFGEYKKQVQLDVQSTGDKIGLSRFSNYHH